MQIGANADRTVGTELIERVTATGSLVIRKLGETRAGELAIHRFLPAPSVTCKEMLGTLAGRTLTAGFFIHPLVAIDSETEAVLGLLDAHIWTRDDVIEATPRRKRAIEDKGSMLAERG